MLAQDWNLVDIWRLVNPGEREYTFYSHSHKIYSRIDFFLISNKLVESVMGCEIGTIIISDHGIVELHIDFNVEKERRGRWRLNTMLLHNEAFSNSILEDLHFFLQVNIGSTDNIASVWEASKASIRGKFIAYASKIKKENNGKEKTLEKEICLLEKK